MTATDPLVVLDAKRAGLAGAKCHTGQQKSSRVVAATTLSPCHEKRLQLGPVEADGVLRHAADAWSPCELSGIPLDQTLLSCEAVQPSHRGEGCSHTGCRH